MFGGYLAFYIKESKALKINVKTAYWAHPKNRLHNPTSVCMCLFLCVCVGLVGDLGFH